jgi:hypothetical protein
MLLDLTSLFSMSGRTRHVQFRSPLLALAVLSCRSLEDCRRVVSVMSWAVSLPLEVVITDHGRCIKVMPGGRVVEWPEVLLTCRQVHAGLTAWPIRLVSYVHLVYESDSTVIRSRRVDIKRTGGQIASEALGSLRAHSWCLHAAQRQRQRQQ